MTTFDPPAVWRAPDFLAHLRRLEIEARAAHAEAVEIDRYTRDLIADCPGNVEPFLPWLRASREDGGRVFNVKSATVIPFPKSRTPIARRNPAPGILEW